MADQSGAKESSQSLLAFVLSSPFATEELVWPFGLGSAFTPGPPELLLVPAVHGSAHGQKGCETHAQQTHTHT